MEIRYYLVCFLPFSDGGKEVSYLVKFIHLTDDRDAVFSLHLIRWHMILVCLITSDVNFDHLIKVVSGFSIIKLLIFFF